MCRVDHRGQVGRGQGSATHRGHKHEDILAGQRGIDDELLIVPMQYGGAGEAE